MGFSSTHQKSVLQWRGIDPQRAKNMHETKVSAQMGQTCTEREYSVIWVAIPEASSANREA